jgi:hypothetical protein
MLATRWLSCEEIRKGQRCRRSTVLDAMNCGQLPYEQRGRVRYARTCDVERWEESRLRSSPDPSSVRIPAAFADLI